MTGKSDATFKVTLTQKLGFYDKINFHYFKNFSNIKIQGINRIVKILLFAIL